MASSVETTERKESNAGSCYIGKTNDIVQELQRLKGEYAQNYKPLVRRNIVDVEVQTTLNSDAKDGSKSNQITFKMITFNVLADGLSGAHDISKPHFVGVDQKCLPFEYRGFRLIEEILQYKPDIVALQEVDAIAFFDHYLSPLGYKHVHIAKPSSPCLKIGKQLQKELPPDGSAVFWKSAVFDEVQSYTFSKQVDGTAPKDVRNIAAAVVHLRHQQNPEKELVVASTHFKAGLGFDSERARLKQLCYLLPRLERLLAKKNDVPLFIGTDFNAMSVQKGVYFPFSFQSMVNGEFLWNAMQKDEPDNKDDEDTLGVGVEQKCIQKYDFTKNKLETENVLKILKARDYQYDYGLSFKSAYCYGAYDGKPLGQNPLFTATLGGLNSLDYILFQPHKKVMVTQLLTIPKVENGFSTPQWEYPSDHFSLMTTFRF